MTFGTTICVLHLVPSVPDSKRGLPKYTQRLSTYRRALTLSSALTTTSKPSQKVSLNTSSVSGDTRFCNGIAFKSALIVFAAAVAHVDLAWPMFQSRNRNWRDRLDFSITSSSVTVTEPSAEHARPISAKFLMNSHPSAPAPTRNTFFRSISRCIFLPKHAICASYRLPSGAHSSAVSVFGSGRDSTESK